MDVVETYHPKIVIVGQGLAASMSAAALAHAGQNVTVIAGPEKPHEDALYGGVLPPSFYDFHLGIGLNEPALMLETSTTFCFGSVMTSQDREWVQAFHQPLPVMNGVAMPLLVQSVPGATLQDILISSFAVRAGRFAHPPEDQSHPLSRAEYGYGIDASSISQLYLDIARTNGANVLSGTVKTLNRAGDEISEISLENGETIDADLFIDASGLEAILSNKPRPISRVVKASVSHKPVMKAGAPPRRVIFSDDNLLQIVTTQSTETRLKITSDGEHEGVSFDVPLGVSTAPWTGNVISIGLVAGAMLPLTIAPMKMLLADIQRVLNLIPVSKTLSVETREYNQSFKDSWTHAEMFQAAHGPLNEDSDPKLVRKIEQYEERGQLVSYDFEPFDPLDWAVLHDGLGRDPKRPDRLAAQADPVWVKKELLAMRQANLDIVQKMPPLPIYLSKLQDYLRKRKRAHV